MLTELDTSLPSVKQLQNSIKEAKPVELKLVTGDLLAGKILWQDQYCVFLASENTQKTMIWKQSIVYMKEG
ncbi:MAG: RNA chaperone Hfq [Cyanobacteria bacterium J06639_18]